MRDCSADAAAWVTAARSTIARAASDSSENLVSLSAMRLWRAISMSCFRCDSRWRLRIASVPHTAPASGEEQQCEREYFRMAAPSIFITHSNEVEEHTHAHTNSDVHKLM